MIGRALCWFVAALLVWLPAGPSEFLQQAPTFRSAAELVTIDVNVLGKDGRPVTGLKAEDFVVTLDGKVRPVRVIDYLDFSDDHRLRPPAADTSQPRVSSNANPSANEASTRKPRAIILIVDDLSWKPGENAGLIAAARRWVGTLRTSDLVGVATTSGRGPTVRPTSNKLAVVSALGHIIGVRDEPLNPFNFYLSVQETREAQNSEIVLQDIIKRECPRVDLGPMCVEYLTSQIRLNQRSADIEALQEVRSLVRLFESFKSAAGLPLIVLLSAGLPLNPTDFLISDVARVASQMGVQMSVLLPETSDIDMSKPDPVKVGAKSPTTAQREDNALRVNGINNIAGAVGGQTFRIVGSADPFFERVSAAASGFYRLGVEPPDGMTPRVLSAKVSVSRSGATVRANTKAVLPTTAVAGPPPSIDELLLSTIRVGGSQFGVPVSVASAVRRDPSGGRLQVGLNVKVPGDVRAPLRAMFGVIDESGQLVQAGQFQMAGLSASGDYRSSLSIVVGAGAYLLRVAVADADGLIGSVEHSVNARLKRLGPIFASDLFLSWKAGAAASQFLAMEDIPKSADVLRSELELYGALPDHRLRVKLQVTRQRDGKLVWERDLPATPDGSVLRAVADIQLGPLEPGPYAIRAAVADGDAELGDTSAIFIKAGPAVPSLPAAALPVPADVLGAVREDARQRTPTFQLDSVLTPAEIVRQLRSIAAGGKPALPPEIAGWRSGDVTGGALAALAARGDDPAALTARSIAAMRRGEFGIALSLLTRVSDAVPSAAGVPLLMGAVYAATGHDADAIGAWQLGMSDPSAPPSWIIAQADALARAGDLDGAISALTDARAAKPADAAIAKRTAELLLAAGRFAEARVLLEGVVGRSSADDSSLFLLVALSFADALQPNPRPASIDRFKNLAAQYLAGTGPRRALITGWVAALGIQAVQTRLVGRQQLLNVSRQFAPG